MRYVPLKNAKEGMRLAQDMYDSLGRTLIGVNARITDYYIQKLQEYGFDGIYIKDEFSEGIQLEPIISPQLRQEGISCVRNHDIDGCQKIAAQMVDEILGKGTISLDMTDLRSYDDYTYAHSVNVAVLSCIIGIGFELKGKCLIQLVSAALLHDIGKTIISPDIINKPGRLTPEEFQEIKKHPTISYELIKQRWDISAQVKNAVLFHHENVDGSGYPKGIKGDCQTQMTKIIHVADVYDALTSKRPYKDPYSPSEASEYMMGGCGTLFDRTAVMKLLECVPLYPKGTDVVLSDGRKGIIYENSGGYNLRPIVKLYENGELLDLTSNGNLNLVISETNEKEKTVSESYEKERLKMLEEVRKYEEAMALEKEEEN